ncbi:MAG: siderophore-interacting protein [Mycetocola sp.]
MLRTALLPTTTASAPVPVAVSAITDVGPRLRRFTFTGPSAGELADNRRDQRIKILFPREGVDLDSFPLDEDWYTQWRLLDNNDRPVMRTYTLRHVRPERGEFDVDIVLHGRTGPASSWALDARIGDEVIVIGPNGNYEGPWVRTGVDWHPPQEAAHLLVVGDETALPALAGIVETFTERTRATVIVELPDAGDAVIIGEHGGVPSGVTVRVLERGDAPVGSLLTEQVRLSVDRILAAASTAEPSGPAADLEDVDIDNGILWEVPDAPEDAASDPVPLYSWLAGEASVIKALRRHLVTERGIDRSAVAFMGYWRTGRAES